MIISNTRTLQNFIILFSALSLFACQKPLFEVEHVETRFISNIDFKPIFSWKVASDESGFYQSACQVIIADNLDDAQSNVGNVWDSGKMDKINDFRFKYKGNTLVNGQRYYVKVRVWDQNNTGGKWSDAQAFFVPLEYPKNWNALWLSYSYQSDAALPVFKKVLNLSNSRQIDFARLYIAAPGYYEAFLNGNKIGKNVLDPGQTNYEDYTYYSAYNLDITTLQNPAVLGVMLGNGWYNQNVVWGKNMIYGQPVFIAQLVVKYKDGTTETIGSDESWMWKPGPITFSNVYAGETYNANLEVEDWMDAKNTSADWQNGVLANQHPTQLFEQFAEPIQKMDKLSVKEIIDKGEGRYIVDFGQNFAGWVKLKIEGAKGQEITIRCTEELDENGEIDPRTTGFRATKVIQTQKYICKGEGTETWEPQFTYFGFRYVEVQGLTQKPQNDFLEGMVVYSSLPQVGTFSCSEENINTLHQLADWTLKGNIHSIPTDCPHREKCGWTGDAHALAQALMYNYNAQQFISKYMFDMRSSARNTNKELYFGINFHDRSVIDKPKGIPTMIVPGRRTSGTASPDWGTAMVQLPWYLYLYYGDSTMLGNFYPDMKVWVDYVQAKNVDGIITHGLGDWCPPGGNAKIDCPVLISSSAFHILDLKLLAQTAKVLGFQQDFNHYSSLHRNAVVRFNQHFLDTLNNTYGSQTADALALDIDIVPENRKHQVAASIVKSIHDTSDGFIQVGIFGIARIFKVLAQNGCEDEVYRLLTKKGENSFAFMWEHHNATTLWEVLPVRLYNNEEMFYRSHSHPMQGGYEAWFYSGIGGINPVAATPGFRKIVFKPYLTNFLKHANAEYKSDFGLIKSNWENDGTNFNWEIEIPTNSTGELLAPTYGKKVKVTVNGQVVHVKDTNLDFTNLGEFGPGIYHINLNPQ